MFARTRAGTFYPPSLPRTLPKNNHPSNFPSIRRFSTFSVFFFIPCFLPCQCHCFFLPPSNIPSNWHFSSLILLPAPFSRPFCPPCQHPAIISPHRGTLFIDSFRVIVSSIMHPSSRPPPFMPLAMSHFHTCALGHHGPLLANLPDSNTVVPALPP